MAGIVIERIEIEVIECAVGNGTHSFGYIVDETIRDHLARGQRIQRVSVDLSDVDWQALQATAMPTVAVMDGSKAKPVKFRRED